MGQLNEEKEEEQVEESKVKFKLEEEQKNSKDEKRMKLLDRIAEYRLYACQAIMKIGWEVDVECCKQLKEQLERTRNSFVGVKSEQQIKNLDMLIESSMAKINKTLE